MIDHQSHQVVRHSLRNGKVLSVQQNRLGSQISKPCTSPWKQCALRWICSNSLDIIDFIPSITHVHPNPCARKQCMIFIRQISCQPSCHRVSRVTFFLQSIGLFKLVSCGLLGFCSRATNAPISPKLSLDHIVHVCLNCFRYSQFSFLPVFQCVN